MYGPAARYLLFYVGGVLMVTGGILPWWVGFAGLLCIRRPVVFFFLACLLTAPDEPPTDFAGKTLLVKVVELSEKRGKFYQTKVEILGLRQGARWKQSKGKAEVYFPEELSPGQLLELPQGLKLLPTVRQPYAFDYSGYLRRQGIYYQSFLREGEYVAKGRDERLPWSLSARRYLHEVYVQYIGEGPALGIAEAMVSGVKTEVKEEVEEAYISTGTVHALAVSGMHVALLFWMLNLLISRLISPRSGLFVVVMLVILWSYAVFTGLSASVCRSVLMFSLFLIGDYLGRNGNSLNTLFVSALLLLLFRPQWLFDVGFQLSYLAVWGIVELNPLLQRMLKPRWGILRYLWESTSVTLSATLYTLPLTVYYFHQFPNYFLVANPLVNLLCTPLLPLGLLLLVPVSGLQYGVGKLMRFLIDVMNSVVQEISTWPGALSENLSLHLVSLFLFFGLVYFVRIWLAERVARNLVYGGICLFLVFVQKGMELSKQQAQEELVFHGEGFSYVVGRKECRFGEEARGSHLVNYRREKGISVVETRKVEGNFWVETDLGKVICLRKSQEFDVENANFVVISNEACAPERLHSGMNIILDKTNSVRYFNDLKARGLSVTNLRDEGMKIFAHEQTI